MPFALTIIGMLFIITGFQDTYKEFFTEVEGDFTGADSFIYWFISIGLVGSLGYIPELKNFSRASMALILVAMVLADKGGVFAKFNQQIQAGDTTPVNAPGDSLPATGSSGSGSGSSSTNASGSGSISGALGGVLGAFGL